MKSFIKKNILQKADVLMRGKSPTSEHVLEKIKANTSLGFKEDVEREII